MFCLQNPCVCNMKLVCQHGKSRLQNPPVSAQVDCAESHVIWASISLPAEPSSSSCRMMIICCCPVYGLTSPSFCFICWKDGQFMMLMLSKVKFGTVYAQSPMILLSVFEVLTSTILMSSKPSSQASPRGRICSNCGHFSLVLSPLQLVCRSSKKQQSSPSCMRGCWEKRSFHSSSPSLEGVHTASGGESRFSTQHIFSVVHLYRSRAMWIVENVTSALSTCASVIWCDPKCVKSSCFIFRLRLDEFVLVDDLWIRSASGH